MELFTVMQNTCSTLQVYRKRIDMYESFSEKSVGSLLIQACDDSSQRMFWRWSIGDDPFLLRPQLLRTFRSGRRVAHSCATPLLAMPVMI